MSRRSLILVMDDCIPGFLDSLRRRGVTFWAAQGRLHYKAPTGLLSAEEIEVLRSAKDRILVLMETGQEQVSGNTVRHSADFVPLSFSQLAHWNLYELWHRPAYRTIACAIRVQGRLDCDALQRSVNEVVRRHDALRTRVVVLAGAPILEVSVFGSLEINFVDLSRRCSTRDHLDISAELEHLVTKQIDVCAERLVELRLFRVAPDEHVLALAMEHLVTDECSLRILMSGLFTAYSQAVLRKPFNLPTAAQIADYNIRQRLWHRSWVAACAPYWEVNLQGYGRLRFPSDRDMKGEEHVGWGSVPIGIDGALKQRLMDWSRRRHATLPMTAFMVFVALTLRWCGATDAVFRFQSDRAIRPERR